MTTPYSTENANKSNVAHGLALRQFYPTCFANIDYEIESAVGLANDFNRAIDYIARLKEKSGNLNLTIQERFRSDKYRHYQDITITEFNRASDMAGELYKMEADLIVYGYFNESITQLSDTIAIWCAPLKIALVTKRLKYRVGFNQRSQQDFITITFDDLYRQDLVYCHCK